MTSLMTSQSVFHEDRLEFYQWYDWDQLIYQLHNCDQVFYQLHDWDHALDLHMVHHHFGVMALSVMVANLS